MQILEVLGQDKLSSAGCHTHSTAHKRLLANKEIYAKLRRCGVCNCEQSLCCICISIFLALPLVKKGVFDSRWHRLLRFLLFICKPLLQGLPGSHMNEVVCHKYTAMLDGCLNFF